MNWPAASFRWMLAAAAIAAVSPPIPASAQSGAVALAAHRAVYDLRLANTRGKSPMQAVRGRILYDFSGNTCEGYALQFRQVSELDSGEGKVTCQRPARHLLGGGRGQAVAVSFAELLRPAAARDRRRPGRAR